MTDKNNWKGAGGGGSSMVYFAGLVGALIYFLQRADSFQSGVVGVLKAFAWPGVLVYKALQLLGM